MRWLVAVEVRELFLIAERARRTVIFMAVVVRVPMRHPRGVIEVVMMAIMHVVVRQQRIPMTATRMRMTPRADPKGSIPRAVVIAEVIVRVTRPDPEVNQKRRALDDAPRRVIVRVNPGGIAEVNRSEKLPACRNAIVPITLNEQATAGSPDPVSRHPHPILLIRMPIARPPAMTRVVPHPA